MNPHDDEGPFRRSLTGGGHVGHCIRVPVCGESPLFTTSGGDGYSRDCHVLATLTELRGQSRMNGRSMVSGIDPGSFLSAPCSVLDASRWLTGSTGRRPLDAGCWMLDAGCWMLDAGCRIASPVFVHEGVRVATALPTRVSLADIRACAVVGQPSFLPFDSIGRFFTRAIAGGHAAILLPRLSLSWSSTGLPDYVW